MTAQVHAHANLTCEACACVVVLSGCVQSSSLTHGISLIFGPVCTYMLYVHPCQIEPVAVLAHGNAVCALHRP